MGGFIHPGLPPATLTQEQANEAIALANRVNAPPAEPTPAAPTESAPTAPSADGSLIFGKYASPEEAEKGYWELQNTLKVREQALNESTSRARELEQLIQSRQANPAAGPTKRPEDALMESGIDPSPIRQMVYDGIQSALAPLVAGAQAKQAVAQEFPDYPASENEVASFISSRPELQARYQEMTRAGTAGAVAGATEWAYLRYQSHQASQPRVAVPINPATRGDAALPSTSGGGRTVPAPSQEERMKDAQRYYQIYGDERPLVHERLKGIVPDSHFKEG